ncbi:N-acetylglucosamine-6-phosphate deacetylase [Anaerococcus lactolyticus ATCC 51172]|uniref:N-acetylglucosamine-6-phosphate deacetylase n=1 Tax=Anaerococcus lactolyticus ATCC 51172 TaxID=525254 RepID=C2BGE2_9FIRM|nr:N-acetylglucosamine-6-phosphate deacetylase [Anaerococcus lactolyticus]EEI86069.1 N-acetylglucosamine-6-phosphate deacetylase [Anaerococcus lactolyticus ATCC 51172]
MIYKADYFILEDSMLEDYFMEVEDGVIVGFSKNEPDEYEYLGEIVAPGLVDTHIHGYAGKDIMNAEEGALNVISKGLLECGVTSFLPTTLTDSKEKTDAALKQVALEYKDVEGAKVRGIFLEGPFFTEKYKGAQNPAYMSDPKVDYLKEWIEISDGLVNKIAIAPEREGASDFIKKANAMGVRVALGHSDASFEQAVAAVDAGANIFVHTYNGMSGLHHREPGMVGAAMSTDAISELICDGHHVNPNAANILMNAKGRDKIALITDCMSAGGMADGDYMLGEFPVRVEGGTARLKEGGSLAGSILKLKEAVKNVVDWEIADIFEAIQMASLIPAKSVGIDNVCGKLHEGYSADFIVLDYDKNLKKTFLNGKLVYSK